MIHGRIITLVMIGLIVTQSYVPLARAAPKTHFTIVYTNDVMGEVEPCG